MEYLDYFINPDVWGKFGMIKDGVAGHVFYLPCFLLWLTIIVMLTRKTQLKEIAILGLTTNPLSLLIYLITIASPLTTIGTLMFFYVAYRFICLIKPRGEHE